MNAGRLDQRITVQTYTETPNEYGEPVKTWTDYITAWARIEPLRGRELFKAQRFGEMDVRITIRYRDGIDETMRIRHGETIYSLIAPPINPDYRNVMLELMCREGEQEEA